MSQKSLRIDVLQEGDWRYDSDAVIFIDIFLTTTCLVTAASQQRRVLVAADTEDAFAMGRRLDQHLRAADVGESCPRGFDASLGPAALSLLSDSRLPLIYMFDGAGLLGAAGADTSVYIACLRNLAATAAHVANRHTRVAILCAGDQGESRCEDQIAAAKLAVMLQARGFAVEDRTTAAEIARWRSADIALVGWGRSAEALRAAGRAPDVEFVLKGVDDLDAVCSVAGREIVDASVGSQAHAVSAKKAEASVA